MKKRKTNQLKLWAMGVMVIVLSAASLLQADETVPVGQTKDINYAVSGLLFVSGTANLRSGAFASSVYVQYEGRLNIYSGTVDLLISVSRETLGTTIYGTDFAVDSGTIDSDGNWTPDLMGTLTGKYEDGTDIDLWILSDTSIKLVDIENEENDGLIIDIKPGSDENVINLKSRGVVPVAVMTTEDFQAGNINPDSVEFAGASPVRSSLCDVDNDGDMDMLFHFRTQMLNLDETSTEATLTAMLKSLSMLKSAAAENTGEVLKGKDKVKIMSSNKYSSAGKHAPKPKRYVSMHRRSKPKHKDR
ncbi:MAG: hypothetical protein RQ760_21165 [Sedimentisphaerales bacterium]|nr:hypothetical protein [Sedimentisphaerales bacterium]